MSDEFDFLTHAKGWVEFTEAQFTGPDDDWEPIAFLAVDPRRMKELAEQDERLHARRRGDPRARAERQGPADAAAAGGSAQPEIYGPLKSLLVHTRASRLVLIFSVWMSFDPLSREKYGQVADDPSRTEKVLLFDLTKERLDVWTAPVVRSQTVPPMLAAWHQELGEASTQLTDDLKEALT